MNRACKVAKKNGMEAFVLPDGTIKFTAVNSGDDDAQPIVKEFEFDL